MLLFLFQLSYLALPNTWLLIYSFIKGNVFCFFFKLILLSLSWYIAADWEHITILRNSLWTEQSFRGGTLGHYHCIHIIMIGTWYAEEAQ